MTGIGHRRFGLGLLILLAIQAGLANATATQSSDAIPSQDRLETALRILEHLPTGRDLLSRAKKFWNLGRTASLRGVLKFGEASKTDAVLTRHFNPKTGEETRERQVTVYLRERQNLDDLVLDLAHELVHATTRPGWDPYDPRLTAGKYIWAAIEGEEIGRAHV